jgi:protein tyrosine/serine phosphatase
LLLSPFRQYTKRNSKNNEEIGLALGIRKTVSDSGCFMEIQTDKLEEAHPFIPNLRLVSLQYVRGGQPEPEGIQILAAAGVKTVVNLCAGQGSGLRALFGKAAPAADDPELAAERRCVEELGMSFVQIPLDVFRTPSTEHLERFVEVISSADNGPIFTHCLHGRDRTGIMTAIYRVVHDGWPPEKAYEEMVACGFDTYLTNLSDAFFGFAKTKTG